LDRQRKHTAIAFATKAGENIPVSRRAAARKIKESW
jgi:hypothetical protein